MENWEKLAEGGDYDLMLNALSAALEADLSSKRWPAESRNLFTQTMDNVEKLITLAEA